MHLAFLCVLQQLVVAPQPAEVGGEVVLRLETEEPVAKDFLVTVDKPSGESESVLLTGATGEVRYIPKAEGQHVFSTVLDGVRLVTPLEVVGTRPRWLYALVCIPVGLALLIAILRGWLADRTGPGSSGQGS